MSIGQFDSFILDNVLSTDAQGDIAELPYTNQAFRNLFKHHAGDILSIKVMRRQTTGNPFSQLWSGLSQT